tara:strand:- start:138 stop:911 length:774 start_codon:yes stop_codon:yes gene_type:complete
MPIPSRRKEEKPNDFMSRCLSDNKLAEEFPDSKQRTAVCMGKACEDLDYMEAADFNYSYESYGFEEEINEENFVIPAEADYVDFKEEELEWDFAAEKPGLWENIRRKKDREGKKYKPAQPGDPDRPTPEQIKKAQSDKPAKGAYLYEHPKTGEVSTYSRKGVYTKDGEILIYKGKASEYQGRKVKLNKPFRTPDGPKKFSVYVKNQKGNVVKVNFGDPNMEIKKDNPARRKSFRARHKCDTAPGPKWKARYWSCKNW